jgi:CRP/FNR family cyclic AMP-dependent transcriptional regulator
MGAPDRIMTYARGYCVDQRTKRSDAIQSILARDPLLRALSRASQTLLKDALRPADLSEDDVLFRRDAPVDGCYLVEQGALRVSVEDLSGGETWLAIVGAGDWVGELGLLDRQPRSATVTALTACRLWRLPIKEFDSLCRIDFEFYRSMVLLICVRLRSANREVCEQRLGFQARLAQTMLKLAKAFGTTLPDGRTMIRYRVRQGRLAEITGASRENVNRQFATWKKAGLFDTVDGNYCLSDLPKWSSLGQDYSPTVAS